MNDVRGASTGAPDGPVLERSGMRGGGYPRSGFSRHRLAMWQPGSRQTARARVSAQWVAHRLPLVAVVVCRAADPQ